MNVYDYPDPNDVYTERDGCGCLVLVIVAMLVAVVCLIIADRKSVV